MNKIKEKIKHLKKNLAKDARIAGTAILTVSPAMAAPQTTKINNNSPTPIETQISAAPDNNIVTNLDDITDMPAFGSEEWLQTQTRPTRQKNKYTTTTTVRNDSVTMIGATQGYYNAAANEIYMHKGDMTFKDFGFENAPDNSIDVSLIIIHENQHKINRNIRKVGQKNLTMNENYQIDVHDEITALIAEKLEIRRQYKEAATPKAKEAILQKYQKSQEHQKYINAIRSGLLKPDSSNAADFSAEMAFIKDDATQYRADPNDNSYGKNWRDLAIQHMIAHNGNLRPNPAALAAEIHSMYQIGGIDFTQYGHHSDIVLESQGIIQADKFITQGVSVEKVKKFLEIGGGPFQIAETLDVSGLSRQQAEQVLQQAILSQEIAKNLSVDLCLGDQPDYDFYYIAGGLMEKTAVYLDIKADIWEKNNTLSEQGDEKKFNILMNKAQTISLNPKAQMDMIEWFINHRNQQFTSEQLETIRKNITTLQNKKVSVPDVVINKDEMVLPLDDTSVENVIASIRQKEEEDKKYWEDYYATHPQKERRLSAPYEVEIMDLQSNILRDEIQNLTLNKLVIEPMFSPQNTPQNIPSEGGFQLKRSQYTNAEFVKTTEPTGAITEVVLIDGKKHGAEITTDANGGQLSFKLYNHGQEIDLSKNKVEIKNEFHDGAKHSYILLNGERFGTETITLPDGTTKAAFYETDGIQISNTKTSAITCTEVTRDTLKQDLLAQQGNISEHLLAQTQNSSIDKHLQKQTHPNPQNTTSPQQSASNNLLPKTSPLPNTR